MGLTLADLIVKTFDRDGFQIAIVYGDLRIGKTAYSCKACAEALGILYGKNTPIFDIPYFDSHMGWHPSLVAKKWFSTKEKQPFFIWDDGGVWLWALNFNDPALRVVQQYFNLIGVNYGTLIITAPLPTWILSKIRNFPSAISIKITRTSGEPTEKWSRRATAYQSYLLPDMQKQRVRKLWYDDFNCLMPNKFFEWYNPIREHYNTIIKDMLMQKTEEQYKEYQKQGLI